MTRNNPGGPMEDILTEADALKAVSASAAGPVVIYKHSPICDLSQRAEIEVLEFLSARSGSGRDPGPVRFFRVDVIAARAASMEIARILGVRHESPQVLLVRNAECLSHASHRGIHRAWLEKGMQELALA